MRLKKLYLLLFCCFSLNGLKAQDWHLSMYDAAPMYLNPALTGVVDGQWRIHGQYRNQWSSVNYKAYNTALISFDVPYKKWGFGAQIVNYRAGIGNFNALQGVGSIGYTISLDKRRAHNITFGVQGGLTQKRVEYQLHTYNSQYTTTNGGGFDNGLASGETFNEQAFIIPELNAGLLYYYAKQQTRLNPFLGISAFNLLTPNESWYGANNKLPMRFYAHAGTRINITETFYLIPKVLFMYQEPFTELTFAVDAGIYLKPSEFYILGGLTFRNRDAFIASIGAKKANYIAKVSYDVNLSKLAIASSYRGGFEISFTYMHQKKDKKTVKICPRL
ncbi:MAG: PorP/SprF family type IX secretion system membrane protein [Crocinitomicaceae bacterium]